jgi:4-hydroxy-2-oxoheptanedioate aldolase
MHWVNEEEGAMISFKELAHSNHRFLGMFIQSTSSEFVEIVGYTGFDFIIIDMEHGPIDYSTSRVLAQAADAAGIVSTIRVAEKSPVSVCKALDTGVSGVVVPGISSVSDAEAAIGYARYAPLGVRGACPCVRANRYGIGGEVFYKKANETTSVILLLEGKSAIESFDAISNIKGLDAILLGPVDLSHSLGFPGQIHHHAVTNALIDMINKGKERNVCIGVFCTELQEAKRWFEVGVNYVVYSVDTMLFAETCSKLKASLMN